MRILVTGGSGTLGGYILRELLAHEHHVSCYSRTAPPCSQVTFVPGDITDTKCLAYACCSQEAIIHLAAVPGPGRASPQQMMTVNLTGTVNVLETARQLGIKSVVLASSAAVLGFSFQKTQMTPRYFPIDEDHPCEPQDEYGLSKLLAELACKSYSQGYGLRTLCLRINHNWYVDREGAWQAAQRGWARGMTVEDLWSNRYRRTILDAEGDWPVPGPPSPRNNLWTVTDARDAAQAFRLAVENNQLLHEVFFINGADSCSLVETRTLVSRYYPQVRLKADLADHASLVSYDKAARLLGYRPAYTWRRSDFWDWLSSNLG